MYYQGSSKSLWKTVASMLIFLLNSPFPCPLFSHKQEQRAFYLSLVEICLSHGPILLKPSSLTYSLKPSMAQNDTIWWENIVTNCVTIYILYYLLIPLSSTAQQPTKRHAHVKNLREYRMLYHPTAYLCMVNGTKMLSKILYVCLCVHSCTKV